MLEFFFLLSCLSYHIWIHELLPKSVTYKELRAYARKFTLGIVYLLKVTRVKGKREGWKKKVEIDTGHARGREKVWATERLWNRNEKGTRELGQRGNVEMFDINLDPVTRNSGDLQSINLGLWLMCNRGTVMADRNPKCEAAEGGGHATTQVLDSRLILLSRHRAFRRPQKSSLTGSGTRNWRTGRVKSRRREDLRTGWGRSHCRWAGRLCWGRARAPAAGSGCLGSPSELQRDRGSDSERPGTDGDIAIIKCVCMWVCVRVRLCMMVMVMVRNTVIMIMMAIWQMRWQ